MIDIRTLARPLLAGVFVAGGIDSLMEPDPKRGAAREAGVPVAEATGLPEEPDTLVKINGGVQVGAGLLLATNRFSRLAALALAGTLVPTTLGAHRFWEIDDADERQAQTFHFMKNAAILGGLVFAALDTEGRPSVFWTGRKAAGTAASTAVSAGRTVADTVIPG